MITVHVAEEDAAVLLRTLEWALSETRMEVAGTDTPDFRETIKREQASLERVVEELRSAESSAAAR